MATLCTSVLVSFCLIGVPHDFVNIKSESRLTTGLECYR